ncbi:FAD-binding oxidoreductase [Capillimicrobium parvum]|uniref:Mitomycin radical oxidase n=1 Tax=Capillimicrobium parvum TaxID=2884022 RepID=A0A9E7C2G4_9ACTN|nr:FAD-dependent oxidoreductase [Capillimicrobium parvum]UGS38535.1 Mitomycin radical oxidase [Capillimicrobium parvum]
MTTSPLAETLPTVVTPGDATYDEQRRGWNLAADQRPAAIVTATTAEEVRAAVAYAAEHELTVAVQGTGHRAVAVPSLERSLLLRTELHDSIEIDVAARRARVKAGALWEHVVEAAAPHGLACLHGSSPNVGVVGYLLGGGLSFYARRYGVASNHVTAIELVTAEAELRRVDAERDPDLFWALRGGGGGFGVVTAIELDLQPIETVYAGIAFYDVHDAPAVLRAWRDWCETAPDAVTTSFRILALPPVPEVPEPVRGRTVAAVDGIALVDQQTGAELLAPLRAAAPPIIDAWTVMPAAAALRVHGDPEPPLPCLSGTSTLGELDDAALDAFLTVTGEGSGSPLLMAELRQLGGAVAQAPAGAGVTGAIPGAFVFYGVGVPATPELAEAIPARADTIVETLRPWSTGRQTLNFVDQDGPATDVHEAAAYARLVRTRRRWDPQRRFLTSHAIV